jgi:hypothetical protein
VARLPICSNYWNSYGKETFRPPGAVGCAYERLRLLARKILHEDFPRFENLHETGSVLDEDSSRNSRAPGHYAKGSKPSVDQGDLEAAGAVQRGYQDADHMKKDMDFESIRSHPEFQKMVRELEFGMNVKTVEANSAQTLVVAQNAAGSSTSTLY